MFTILAVALYWIYHRESNKTCHKAELYVNQFQTLVIVLFRYNHECYKWFLLSLIGHNIHEYYDSIHINLPSP